MTASALPNSVPAGRTGVITNTTAYAPLMAGTTATNPIQAATSAGVAGQIFTSNGPTDAGTYQNPISSAYQKIATMVASGTPSVSFAGLSNLYSVYKIYISGMQPSVNGANLLMRCSQNNGSSYDASSAYNYAVDTNSVVAGLTRLAGSGTGMIIINNLYNMFGANNAEITMYNAGQSALQLETTALGAFVSSTNDFGRFGSAGDYGVTGVTNAVQLLCDSGVFTTGVFELYGILM